MRQTVGHIGKKKGCPGTTISVFQQGKKEFTLNREGVRTFVKSVTVNFTSPAEVADLLFNKAIPALEEKVNTSAVLAMCHFAKKLIRAGKSEDALYLINKFVKEKLGGCGQ